MPASIAAISDAVFIKQILLRSPLINLIAILLCIHPYLWYMLYHEGKYINNLRTILDLAQGNGFQNFVIEHSVQFNYFILRPINIFVTQINVQ